MQQSVVVFDFDGTLAETREAVSRTVNGALHDAGLPRVVPEAIWSLMGLPLQTLFTKSIPRTMRGDADVPALVAHYRQSFDDVGAPFVVPMPGAQAVLTTLRDRGVPLAIATSREMSSLAPLLDRFGWTSWFDRVVTCDQVAAGKPDPETLRRAMDGRAARCMVGDTSWDMAMARTAGVVAVGVPDGCHDADALRAAGADVVLDHLADLPAWLDKGGADGPTNG